MPTASNSSAGGGVSVAGNLFFDPVTEGPSIDATQATQDVISSAMGVGSPMAPVTAAHTGANNLPQPEAHGVDYTTPTSGRRTRRPLHSGGFDLYVEGGTPP